MDIDGLGWWAALGLAALFWLGVLEAHRRMWRAMPRLTDVSVDKPGSWPRVSVIVPSCNEEQAVQAAARSLLAQDYPDLEVVAVDDRSTDRTGSILDGLAAGDPRFHAVHVEKLPPGWLGKNHANHQGSQRATGEWLLFTDGDVMFSPDALRRAIHFAEHNRLDHLVAQVTLLAPGFWERCAQTASFSVIATHYRTWDLQRARTKGFVGMGAFNLVRRSAYDAVGGHTKLAMEVSDDMKLAMILRRSGFRAGMVDSAGLVRVRWQEGFWSSWRGLIKNAWAGSDWTWPQVVSGSLFMPVISLAPWLAVLTAPSIAMRALGLFSVVAALLTHGYGARRTAGGSGLEGITNPVMGLMLMGTIALAAILATVRGGITWRGTFYPLAELRRACVREKDWPLDKVVGVVAEVPVSVVTKASPRMAASP